MTTQTEEKLYRIPDNQPLTFQAIGIVRGKLLNLDSGNRGDLLLITEQGIFPLQIQRELGHYLGSRYLKNGFNFAEHDLTWLVYPKQFKIKQPDGTKQRPLGFTLAGLLLEGNYDESKINKFSIRGVVSYQNAKYDCLNIALKRNVKVKQELKKKAQNLPFKVEVVGQLPEKGIGWFWELECELEGGKLILIDGKKLEQMPIPGKPKKPFSKKPSKKPNKKVLPSVAAKSASEGSAKPVKKKIEAPVDKPKKKFSFEAR